MPPNTKENTIGDVSVIIPAYNAEDTIVRALKSIIKQTVKPYEIIIIDDGSSDGTYQTAAAMANQMEGITLTIQQQANKGAGAARNTAIGQATASIIAFLDADDEWLPQKLKRSLEVMQDDDYVLVAHNGYIVKDENETVNNCAVRFHEDRDPFVTLYRKGFLDTCTVIVRRDAVLAAGGFDETLLNAQDFELWLAILGKQEQKFTVFPEVLSRYYVRPGSIMSNTARRVRCCKEIARRYATTLKHFPGSVLGSVCYRIVAIYYEAFRAYQSSGDNLAAGRMILAVPFQLLGAIFDIFIFSQRSRHNYLKSQNQHTDDAATGMLLQSWFSRCLWLWVPTIFAAYLYQFRELYSPILNVLGLQ
jgi:teichuronic acid biosynthesis glycosyltransferase TuaG